ncbi:hypothetical protein AMJ57_04340 [Parcubacteria bacterium SG8_24]|nr:MAG: hypothetical protein AMJ57_04340 [Parcubacteria bacterium SG8_24]
MRNPEVAVRDIKFFQRFVLDCGLTVYAQFRDMPWFDCSLIVGVGERHDPPDKPGVAHLLEHMMSSGTEGRPRVIFTNLQEWAHEQGFLVCYGETSLDYMEFGGKAAVERADDFFRFLHDFVRKPTLDYRLEHERKIIRAERREDASTKERQAARVMGRAVFGQDHPLALAGTWPEDRVLNSITHDDVRKMHREFFEPPNMTLIVVGGIRSKQLQETLAGIFTSGRPDFRVPERPAPLSFSPPDPRENRIRLSRESEPETVTIGYYWHLPPVDDSTLDLLTHCWEKLLNHRIRERQTASYEVEVDVDRCVDHIQVSIEVTVAPEDEVTVRQIINETVVDEAAICRKFNIEKRAIILEIELEDQTIEDLIEETICDLVVEGGPVLVREIVDRLNAVKPEQVIDLLREHFRLDHAYVELTEE